MFIERLPWKTPDSRFDDVSAGGVTVCIRPSACFSPRNSELGLSARQAPPLVCARPLLRHALQCAQSLTDLNVGNLLQASGPGEHIVDILRCSQLHRTGAVTSDPFQQGSGTARRRTELMRQT